MTSERVKGHLCVLTANTIFGVFIPVSKYLMSGHISPYALTMFRMLGAAVLFWTASLFVREKRVDFKTLCWFFFFALTGIVLNQGLFIFALGHTSPTDASVILTATPFAALFISAAYLGDKITRRKLAGIFTGAAGAVWLITTAAGGGAAGGSGSIFGDGLVLFTTVCAATYFVVSKPLAKVYSPITMMKWMFTFSTLVFAPFFWWTSGGELAGLGALSAWDWTGVAYVVAGATFVAYMLLPMGIKRMRPTTVAMYIYVQPIVSSVVAIAVGQDAFMWSKLFASALVFAGVYVVTSSPRAGDKSVADER